MPTRRIYRKTCGKSLWREEPRNERAKLHGAGKRQPRSEGRLADWGSGARGGAHRSVYLARPILSVLFIQLPSGAGFDAGLARPADDATSDRRQLGNHTPEAAGS